LLHAREAQIRAPSPSTAAVPPVPPLPTKAQSPVIPPSSIDSGLPPRPKFTTPPPERDDIKTPSAPVVSPPTPERAASPTNPEKTASPKSERSKEVAVEEKPILSSAATVTRSGSGDTSRTALRRPGGARGPRAAPGSAASPTTHRASGSFTGLRPKSPPSSIVADPKDYVPKKKDGRVSAGAFGKRGPVPGDEA